MGVEIRIPRLGWSMEEGVFSGWLVQPGLVVKSGQALFTLEGEKATQEIESIGEGILHLAPDAPGPGQVVPVGQLIGMLCAEGESPRWPSRAQGASSPSESLPGIIPMVPAPPSVRRQARRMGIDLAAVKPSWPGGLIGSHDLASAGSPPTPSPSGTSVPVTPRARRLAKVQGVSMEGISGTGKGGRVRERDIQALLNHSATAPAGGDTLPITPVRRTIARNMVTSRQHTVPVTLTARADATALQAARAILKKREGERAATLNDMVLHLLGRSLPRHRLLAARWMETHLLFPDDDKIDVGLAVDAPEGLMVPVIRDLARQPLGKVAEQSRDLVARSRSGRLKPADMQGGVFTLSSLGTFGIDHFNPVINYPQTAILGLGGIHQQAVPADGDKACFRPMLPLSLTFDHRVVDGAPAARFLQELIREIEGFTVP